MDKLSKLSLDTQIVMGGTVLYLLFSFFDWQQISFLGNSIGDSEWHGIGFVACLLAVGVLAWEIGRLLQVKMGLGALTPGQISLGLAVLLLLFTVITFFDHNEARHWPAYVGLILSFVIGIFALRRAREEGVQLPSAGGASSGSGGGAA